MSLKEIALPTPQQIAWHEMELEMFVHTDVAVWENRDVGSGDFDLSKYNPEKLDTEQWCDVAESFGAKQIIIVAKHHSGFCCWQTQTTDYCVSNTPWREGKGDIVADLTESCRKRGIKLGIYLSPADIHYGAASGGVCNDAESQKRYDEIYRAQLTELLTNYGEISEVWFDGSTITPIDDILDKYAPGVICFQGPKANIRWPGTEKGILPYPAWNAVKRSDAKTGKATAVHGDPDGECWLGLEADTPIRDHYWFHHEGGEQYLKSLELLLDVYYQSVGHGGVLLLNANPDTTGLVPQADVVRTKEFGDEIKRRFVLPLSQTSGQRETIELNFDAPEHVDHIIIMEDISFGQRVRAYVIEGMIDRQWGELCCGTAVGNKKIDFFEAKIVTAIRFVATEYSDTPIIKKLAAYYVGAVPCFERNSEAVSISNPLVAGNWEVPVGQHTVEVNLSGACRLPGRYEVEVVSTSGEEFRVIKAVIVQNNAEIEDAIVEKSTDKFYELSVTWCGLETILRLTIESKEGAMGKIIVR